MRAALDDVERRRQADQAAFERLGAQLDEARASQQEERAAFERKCQSLETELNEARSDQRRFTAWLYSGLQTVVAGGVPLLPPIPARVENQLPPLPLPPQLLQQVPAAPPAPEQPPVLPPLLPPPPAPEQPPPPLEPPAVDDAPVTLAVAQATIIDVDVAADTVGSGAEEPEEPEEEVVEEEDDSDDDYDVDEAGDARAAPRRRLEAALLTDTTVVIGQPRCAWYETLVQLDAADKNGGQRQKLAHEKWPCQGVIAARRMPGLAVERVVCDAHVCHGRRNGTRSPRCAIYARTSPSRITGRRRQCTACGKREPEPLPVMKHEPTGSDALSASRKRRRSNASA